MILQKIYQRQTEITFGKGFFEVRTLTKDEIIASFMPEFEAAFEEIKSYKPENRQRCLFTKANEQHLDFQFMSYGEDYFNQQKTRLLIVGRASGRYDSKDWTVISNTENGLVFNIDRLVNSVETELNNHLEWLTDSQTQYSKLAKEITRALFYYDISDDDCRKRIATTNLYHFIPHCGSRNPSAPLRRAQEKSALDILKKQLEFLQPTHILFITGKSWITKTFEEALFDFHGKYAIVERPEFRSNNFKHINIYNIIKEKFGNDIETQSWQH